MAAVGCGVRPTVAPPRVSGPLPRFRRFGGRVSGIGGGQASRGDYCGGYDERPGVAPADGGVELLGHLRQERYAAGVRDSLEDFIQGRTIRDDYVMVSDGEIQSGSYKAIYG